MARANPTRRRMPPESSRGHLLARRPRGAPSRGTPRPASSISAARPRRRAPERERRRSRSTVIESKSAPSWNAMPKWRRNSVISRSPSVAEVDAVDLDRAGVGPDQADDVLEQHALAAARAADDHHRLAGARPRDRARRAPPSARTTCEIPRRRIFGAGSRGSGRSRHQKRILVRKKSVIRMAIEASTTAWVVARPTPSAPPRV